MRECYACGRTKSRSDWFLNKGTDYVLCKDCYELIIRREKRLAAGRRNHLKNRERDLANSRHWKERNPEKVKAYNDYWGPRCLSFKGRQTSVDRPIPIREQKCVDCGGGIGDYNSNGKLIRRMNTDHYMYNDMEPLAFTDPRCASCHTKRHWKERKHNGY